MQEAELVLDVLRRSDGASEGLGDIGTGTYRLLFRVLASHPEEVRAFYEDTVAPIVRYDDQYRTDLAATLEAYLEQNCNMNATAAAIFAHRHTVAYRLDRVKELTGLDPTQSEDRERLGLGLKAYRIIAPSLPR
jgi:DNA-binding PucR family transcriptional regulator